MKPFAAAVAAGLSPIPVDTRTKRPMIRSWKQYQDKAADLDEIATWDRWFAQGRCGIAIVCGAVSGRLIALDIERSFAARPSAGLDEALRAAGMFDVFEGWAAGYCERTPNDGLHVLVHIGGDDPVPQNLKLASEVDGNVLIEIRGEGGYCIVAPSRNGDRGWTCQHGSLTEIAWATADEWAAVAAVLASFDESPRQPTSPPIAAAMPPILRLSESWIDEVKASLPDYRSVLEADGWVFGKSDGFGTHCTRPGKDPRLGSSANLSNDGYLWIHSTSTPFPTGVGIDEVAYLFARDHGGRLPDVGERTEALRAHRPQATAGGAAGQAADAGPADGGRAAEASPAASSSVRLDDAFWQSTEWLKEVRAAAWARGLAPSGVLGPFLSRVAATVPMGIWVPAVWGDRAPLNTFCCVVGRSGSGKTASMGVAADLVGTVVNRDIVLGRSLRSGEGLIRLAVRKAAKKNSQLELGEPSYRNAVEVTFDEGSALGRQAERVGATVIPYLNTAWTGKGVVGGARSEDDVSFPADLVRVCAVIGIQYGAAANLFTGESARLGFPQRLLFFGMHDPELLAHDVDAMSMEPIRALHLPQLAWSDYVRNPVYIDVPAHIVREVRLWSQNKDHGPERIDPLDGHMMQIRLRVAALCAVIGGEFAIGDLEWELSRQIWAYSRSIRAQLLTELGDVALERARALGREDVAREEVRHDAWLARCAKRVAAFVTKYGSASMKEIKTNALNQSERPRKDEIVAYAIARGWIIHRDGRYFPRGDR